MKRIQDRDGRAYLRLTSEELALLRELQPRLGASSLTNTVRAAIRSALTAQGITSSRDAFADRKYGENRGRYRAKRYGPLGGHA